MSDSLLGKVLYCPFMAGGWSLYEFSLVLEESADDLLAIALGCTTEEIAGHHYQHPIRTEEAAGTSGGDFRVFGEPFSMQRFPPTKWTPGVVAHVEVGEHRGEYLIWHGHPCRCWFIGY